MPLVLKKTIEIAASLVGAAIFLLALLAGWVVSQSGSSTVLTPHMIDAIEAALPETKAEIGHSEVKWDNSDFSVSLRADNFKLRDETGAAIAEAPYLLVKFGVTGMLLGNFVPSEIFLERPRIALLRTTGGGFSFGGMGTGEDEGGFSLNAYMPKAIGISGAAVSVRDEETGSDWAVAVPSVYLRRQGAMLEGSAQIEVSQGEIVAPIYASYRFDGKGDGMHAVSLRFSGINPRFFSDKHPKLGFLSAVDAPMDGEVMLKSARNGELSLLSLNVTGGAGKLNVPDLWDNPREIAKASLSATYDGTERKVDISAFDVDFGGSKLSAKGDVSLPSPDAALREAPFVVQLGLTDLPMDDYSAIWPKTAIPEAREWIVANVSKGSLTAGEATLRGRVDMNDYANSSVDSGEGKLAISGSTARYVEGMPPVENVSADAVFDLRHMDINVASGNVGKVKILPSVVQLTDFEKDVQYLSVPLNLSGPVREVIAIIDSPPLGYAKEVGVKPEDCDGQMVSGTLELKLPLLDDVKFSDVDLKAAAKLSGFGAKKLAGGMDVSDGTLDLSLDKDGLELKGSAAIAGVPFQAVWRTEFASAASGHPSHQADLSGPVTMEQWRQLGLDLTEYGQGPTVAALKFFKGGDKPSRLSGSVDLRQATINAREINWNKPAGIAVVAEFAADIPASGAVKIDYLSLQGSGISAKGSAALDESGSRLARLEMDNISVGRTDAKIGLFRPDGGKTKFTVEGKSFDASGILASSSDDAKGGGADGVVGKEYVFRLERLYTGENGFISDLRGRASRSSKGWEEIDLQGVADGTHPLRVALLPETTAVAAKGGKKSPNAIKAAQPPKRTLSVVCDDFGKALKGAGLSEAVNGGKLVIKGTTPSDNQDAIEGDIDIGNFSVSGLPVLMRLLDAMSPLGFADLLSGGSSGFDRLRGKFRLEGDWAELREVQTSGASVGINVNGKLNIETGMADLSGTLVPFSFFNRMINMIPILGDVITGGDGQGVIAAAYTVKGNLSDPSISVNPISLLTPGFLRNLFFTK